MGVKRFAAKERAERQSWILFRCFSSMSEVTVNPANPQITTLPHVAQSAFKTVFALRLFRILHLSLLSADRHDVRTRHLLQSLYQVGVMSLSDLFLQVSSLIPAGSSSTRSWQLWILRLASDEKPCWYSTARISFCSCFNLRFGNQHACKASRCHLAWCYLVVLCLSE